MMMRLTARTCGRYLGASTRYGRQAAFASSAAASGGGSERRNAALVQGASRGLGLEFVKQLLGRDPDCRVVATCRDPSRAESLHELDRAHPGRLFVTALDLTDPDSIARCSEEVKANFTDELDLVLNVSGILHVPGEMSPETSLSRVNYDQMLVSFQTHAIGPALVSKAFWPMLQTCARARQKEAAHGAVPLIVNMSARVGSISDNQLGGWYSYRASKSALNQITKTTSVEFSRKKPKVAVISLHPGTCDTDLSAPFQKNYPKDKIFTKSFAVDKLLGVIDSVGEEQNGKFFAWDGAEIPW